MNRRSSRSTQIENDSDASSRSRFRYRRAAMTTMAAVISRGVALLCSLVSVPIALSYLGTERYGLWITLSSFLTLLGFFDLGIGNGLINAVSETYGRGDNDRLRQAVSTAFYLLVLQMVLVIALGLTLVRVVDWAKLLRLDSPTAQNEASPVVLTVFLVLAGTLPPVAVQRLQDGLQEGYITHFWKAIGSVLGLAAMLGVVHLKFGLPSFVAAIAGVPMVVAWIGFGVQVRILRPWLCPDIHAVTRQTGSRLLRTGGVFLILNALTILGFQSDTMIIANVRGAEAVATYAVVQKLSLIAYVVWALITSLWPAYGEALERRDFEWLRKTFQLSLIGSLVIGAVIGSVIAFGGAQIVRLWVGSKVVPSQSLFLAFGCYVVVTTVVGSLAVVLNQSELLVKQVGILAATSVVTVVLKIVLCKKLGEPGVVWATVICFGLIYVIPSYFVVRRRFWTSEGTQSVAGSSDTL